MDITHSVILVTSAGSPISKSMSCHFAAQGAQLILADTNSEALHDTYLLCKVLNENVHTVLLEDHSKESIKQLFAYIDSHFLNGVDVLINNWVGNELPGLLENGSADMFSERLTEVSTALFNYGKQAAKNMREHSKQGVIVNLAANSTENNSGGLENTRAMLTGFTTSWAKELNQFNIRVGGVTPSQHNNTHSSLHPNDNRLHYELIRSTEYIVQNDYFNGRMIEAEI